MAEKTENVLTRPYFVGGGRPATAAELTQWNARLGNNPDGGNVFQGRDFAEHKALTGWRPKFAVLEGIAVTILEKSIPTLGRLWYLPKGPGVTRPEQLEQLLPALKSLAAASRVVAVKLEPEIPASGQTCEAMSDMGLVKVANIQPNSSTVIIDISHPVAEIESRFAAKTKSHIRAARNAGVQTEVVAATDANCAVFYRLLSATAKGNFRIRSERYYCLFWQRHVEAGTGAMLFATAEDQVVAADFLMTIGTKAARKDAATVRGKKIRGAAALLEVAAIEWLVSAGITEYDLCGAPPSSEVDNRGHQLHGVGVFKRGFNNEVTDFVGTWELPVTAVTHILWRKAAERAVLGIHNRRFGESYY